MDIQNLLEIKQDGSVSGPMGPVGFMQEVGKEMGERYNRLARVRFDEPETLQEYEKGEGLTSHDILIMGQQFENDLQLTLWIDMGGTAMPVAMMLESDWDLVVTPRYQESEFARKLSDDEIKYIFEFIIHNPGLIEPEQKETA